MDNSDKTFMWSDGWWIEGSKAWFICGMSNVLFCTDLNTGRCEEVACIPDLGMSKYRLTSFCIKNGRDIFCIPGFGQNIWIYNLDNKFFNQISIDKPVGLQLASQFWICDDAIFIVPANWNKIIEVSISLKLITNYFTICENETIQRGVLIGKSIFMVSSGNSRIYQFDLVTKEIKAFIVPGVKEKLTTIYYDGENFWLSGYQKEVYIWKKESDKLVVIDKFPLNFNVIETTGNKLPIFKCSVAIGEYIWFIPIHGNKIVYADKNNMILSAFEIYDENETEESIFLRQLWSIANYLLEYVRDNRYIGLFSAKSGRILEIDAQELNYQWKEYYLKDKYFFQCGGRYQNIYNEEVNDKLNRIAYYREIQKSSKTVYLNNNKIGLDIYIKIIEEM